MAVLTAMTAVAIVQLLLTVRRQLLALPVERPAAPVPEA